MNIICRSCRDSRQSEVKSRSTLWEFSSFLHRLGTAPPAGCGMPLPSQWRIIEERDGQPDSPSPLTRTRRNQLHLKLQRLITSGPSKLSHVARSSVSLTGFLSTSLITTRHNSDFPRRALIMQSNAKSDCSKTCYYICLEKLANAPVRISF